VTTCKLLIICDESNSVDIDPSIIAQSKVEGFGKIEGMEVRTAKGERLEIHFKQTQPAKLEVEGMPINTGMDMLTTAKASRRNEEPLMTREELRKLRLKQGVTKETFSLRLGISSRTLCYIESGKSITTAIKRKVDQKLHVNLCGDFQNGSLGKRYVIDKDHPTFESGEKFTF